MIRSISRYVLNSDRSPSKQSTYSNDRVGFLKIGIRNDWFWNIWSNEEKNSVKIFWEPKNAVKNSTIFHILVPLLQSRVVAQLLALVFRIVNSTVATRPKTFYDIINLGGLEGLNHAQGEGRRHCGKPLFYCYEITSKKKNTPMVF